MQKDLKSIFLGKLANENFHSMDGQNFNSNEVYAGGPNWNADAQDSSPAQPSQPFIITLTNNTASAIANVVFLDAVNATKRGATNDGVTTGVTATYDLPGYDYPQFLEWLKGIPSRMGMITTVSDTASNLRQSYKIYTYNFNGEDFSKTLFPFKNTFQNQSDQIDMPVDFYLTGTTRITLTSLAAASAITFNFWPYHIASSIQGLGNAPGRTFSNPNVSGMQMITNKKPVSII